MRECVMKLIYCEMLGYESEFGHIHAINFASSSNPFEKRVGYLATSLILHRKHELLYLLINRMQQVLSLSCN
jgi:AP-4 complex subunit epsilon-1